VAKGPLTFDDAKAVAMCYLFSVFAFVMLIVVWVMAELSLRVILTVIYALTWCAELVDPLATALGHALFALGTYFLVFGSSGRGRWRP